MRITRLLFFAAFIMLPTFVFAADSSKDGIVAFLTDHIPAFNSLLYVVCQMIGYGLIAYAAYSLIHTTNSSNHERYGVSKVLITLFVGCVFVNSNLAIQTYTTSQVCDAEMFKKGTCVGDTSSSGISQDFRDKILGKTQMSEQFKKIFAMMDIVSKFLSTVGAVYFFKGFYNLKQVHVGSNSHGGYGHYIFMIIASAILFDNAYYVNMLYDVMKTYGLVGW